MRNLILKTFLPPGIKNKVLIAWRSLKMTPQESIHKYVEQFFAHKLKANVYKSINFEEEKEQFLAGLPEEMSEYVNSQRIRDISQVLHHTMVASTLNFNIGRRKNTRQGKQGKTGSLRGRITLITKTLVRLATTILTTPITPTRLAKTRRRGTRERHA